MIDNMRVQSAAALLSQNTPCTRHRRGNLAECPYKR